MVDEKSMPKTEEEWKKALTTQTKPPLAMVPTLFIGNGPLKPPEGVSTQPPDLCDTQTTD